MTQSAIGIEKEYQRKRYVDCLDTIPSWIDSHAACDRTTASTPIGSTAPDLWPAHVENVHNICQVSWRKAFGESVTFKTFYYKREMGMSVLVDLSDKW